jgi:hypothetical protein
MRPGGCGGVGGRVTRSPLGGSREGYAGVGRSSSQASCFTGAGTAGFRLPPLCGNGDDVDDDSIKSLATITMRWIWADNELRHSGLIGLMTSILDLVLFDLELRELIPTR